MENALAKLPVWVSVSPFVVIAAPDLRLVVVAWEIVRTFPTIELIVVP
jgi:hypothetical protein